MQVKHAVELEDGSYTYQGEITGHELKFLVEFAINELMMRGALPFLSDENEQVDALVHTENTTTQ